MAREIQEVSIRKDELAGCVALVSSKNQDFFEYHRDVFASRGFVPIRAATVRATEAILRLIIVSVVVIDQENGVAACRKILRHSRSAQPHAPVLVIAGGPDPHFREEALSLGAAEYLERPAVVDDIQHAFHLPREAVPQ